MSRLALDPGCVAALCITGDHPDEGLRPITIVELDMDRCTLVYGVGACAAIGAAANSCYNTRATCQYSAAFTSAVQTYRLSDSGIGLPPEVEAIPCIESVSIAPTRLTPLKGLGQRASINVILNDFAHHDRVFDPYVADRAYAPEDQGSFWARFRARHKYYQGRTLRVMTGSILSPWDWACFQDRNYVIEKISGPDRSGKMTITAKDVIKLADNDRSTCPKASTSTLSADISAAATSLTLLPAGIGAAEYAVREQVTGSGYVRIGSEIMAYTRSADVLTITRGGAGAWGTTAAAHTAGDTVQLCASWSAANVATVILEMLGANYAGIPAAYLTSTAWASEASGVLSAYLITGIVSKPEGVNKLIAELAEQCMLMVWWDEVTQLIQIKGIAPPTVVTELTDDANLIMDTVQVEDDPTLRVSQVWVYYSRIDASGDDKPENYRNLYVQADLNAEGADQYGEQRIKQIKSRWLTTAGPVAQIASRSLNWLRDNPRAIRFVLDGKDRDLDVGEAVDITSDAIQGASGAPLTTGAFVTERRDAQNGRIEYSALSVGWRGRYGHIAPGGSNATGTHVPSTYSGTIADYSTATDGEKAAYCYVIAGGSNSTGTHVPVGLGTKFNDDGDAYQIS